MTKRRLTSSPTGADVTPLPSSSADVTGPTTSQVQLATFVTTGETRFDDEEREYLCEMFQKEIFGALLTACRVRMEEEGFSRAELGRRMAKNKSVITRLLKGRSNMQANTIAEFANAVEADISFNLIDRKRRNRLFTGRGVEHFNITTTYFPVGVAPQPVELGRAINMIFATTAPNTVSAQLSAYPTVAVTDNDRQKVSA